MATWTSWHSEQAGSETEGSHEGIFFGNGNGTFREASLFFTNPDGSNCSFDIKGPCSADIIDIDNDGRLDIVCAGHQEETNYNVVLHQQGIDDGGIHFSVEPYEANFLFSHVIIQAADMNNDGYQDFVISAEVDEKEDWTRFTDVYLNDTLCHGRFSRLGLGDNDGIIKRKANGILQVADFNNDGWTDILLSGDGDASSGETAMRQRMYLNQKTFSPAFANVSSDATGAGYVVQTSVNNAAGVIDWDGDGSYDLLMCGTKRGTSKTEGYLYLNQIGTRAGRLSKYFTIPGATALSIIFPDWNGDGRKDYFVSGQFNDDNYLTQAQRGTARVMCYNLYPIPKRPDAPRNPTATVAGDSVLLQWERAETAQPNFTYEVFIRDGLGNLVNSTPAFVGDTRDGNARLAVWGAWVVSANGHSIPLHPALTHGACRPSMPPTRALHSPSVLPSP